MKYFTGMIEKMHVLNQQLAAFGFDPDRVKPIDFSSTTTKTPAQQQGGGRKTQHNKSSDELDQNDLDDLLGTSG